MNILLVSWAGFGAVWLVTLVGVGFLVLGDWLRFRAQWRTVERELDLLLAGDHDQRAPPY